jgi:hypothetical protein
MGFGAWVLGADGAGRHKKNDPEVAIHAAIDHGIRSPCTVTRLPFISGIPKIMVLTRPEWAGRLSARTVSSNCSPTIPGFQTVCDSSLRRVQTVYDLAEKSRVSLRFN